eukprot:14253239-Alexandrium_andersonii.AAC.1
MDLATGGSDMCWKTHVASAPLALGTTRVCALRRCARWVLARAHAMWQARASSVSGAGFLVSSAWGRGP